MTDDTARAHSHERIEHEHTGFPRHVHEMPARPSGLLREAAQAVVDGGWIETTAGVHYPYFLVNPSLIESLREALAADEPTMTGDTARSGLREAALASFRELHIRYNHSEDFTDCGRPTCADRRAALDTPEDA